MSISAYPVSLAQPDRVRPSSTRRSVAFNALLIFTLALAARVLFIAIQEVRSPAAWSSPVLFGESEMDQIAVNLAQGRGFSSPYEKGSTPSAWVCPLVPFLWAFVIWCAGGPTGFAHLLIAYTGTVPSAACVVVYWLITRHMLRGSPALQRAAFLVASVFCLWPDSLYELAAMWYFPWQELAVALLVLLGMNWMDRPSFKTVASLGAMGGVLALINVAPMPIFIVILLLPVFNRAQWKRNLHYAVAGALLALLLTLPWLIRNAVVLHAVVPMRSSGGYQFWAGNNAHGSIRPAADTLYPANQISELKRFQSMGEIAYCRQGYRDALAYIRTHPRKTLLRLAARGYVFWLTDAFDQWRWDSNTPGWWTAGRPAIMRHLSFTLAAWVLTMLTIWAVLSGRLTELPYKGVFAGILFFVPFPYYFTIAQHEYSQILRSWLLLLTILTFSAGFQRKKSRRPAAAEAYAD